MTKAQKSKLTKSDLSIAKQRIECAIYAFGGSVTRKQPQRQPQPDKRSIFRTRNESESSSSATTPSSNKSASQGGGKKKSKQPSSSRSKSSVRRERYEKKLRQQYFEHGNRLSWDVQANLSLTLNGAKTFDEYDDNPLKKSGSSMDQSENGIGGSSGRSSSQRRNRCKKCGQIKHGHVCPFQSSLQRSIGIMVYPSANAHVANEPGMLAPALCEMNNFISIKSGSFEVASGGDRKGRKASAATVASTVGKLSKGGVLSGGDAFEVNPFRRKTIHATVEPPVAMCTIIDDKRSDEEEGRDHDKADEKQSASAGGGGRGGAEDLLFQPQMEITLDQYRAVTPSKDASSSSSSENDYVYPQVPLTFTQRKSMSDALFSLSKLVPELTDECGLVLTEARKRDQWDLAVAELMTQVICVLHCSPEKDYTLEGLRKYLMGLGIVC
mmetsp:Transcript_17347/g.37733  ORF Transcript_17347/g.37733 Transcript_17347/m.37733 type:complete len:439 (-) Transcript_17347:170-1486(-)